MMRSLFLLMVGVNVVLLYLSVQRELEPAQVTPALKSGESVGELKLMSEVDPLLDTPLGGISIPTYEPVEKISKATSVPDSELTMIERTGDNESSPEPEPEPEPVSQSVESKAVAANEKSTQGLAGDEKQRQPVLMADKAENLVNSKPELSAKGAEVLDLRNTENAQKPAVAVEKLWVCGAVGVFDEGTTALRFIERLKSRGLDASLRREQVEAVSGYWVLIPAFDTSEEAIAAVTRLRQKGIKDFRRFVQGERKNSISLGLFSSRKNAERRRNDVLKTGEKIIIEQRVINREEVRVDFRGTRSEVDVLKPEAAQMDSNLEVEEYPCSRIVTDGGIF